MSSLSMASEMVDDPPRWTAEEKRRIQEYQPQGHAEPTDEGAKSPHYYARRPSENVREWTDNWRRRLADLERWGRM